MTQPSFGQSNTAEPLGDPDTLKINEWFANGEVRFQDDWIEIYNPHTAPVDLGGMYITDNPVGQPDKFQITPLSFVPGVGFTVLEADDANSPGHVDFRLSAEKGMTALLDSQLKEIDKIIYGPQTEEFSQGRAPDGTDTFSFLPLPTPGLANPVMTTQTTTTLVGTGTTANYYVPSDATWQTTWMLSGFNDLQWDVGPTPLGFGACFGTGEGLYYNDCRKQSGDSTAENVTDWTIYDGYTSHYTGPLKDFNTGIDIGTPTVTFSMVNNVKASSSPDGGDPATGTDAYEIFYDDHDNKIVDFSGGTVYYGSSGWSVEIEFTDLDASATYIFVGTAIRAKDYPNRISLFTLSDVTSAIWNSSVGVGGSGYTAELQAGDNSAAGRGYVVRWDDIVPGPDGDFTVRAEATPTSDNGRAYPFHGFMLEGGYSGSNLQGSMLNTNASLWSRIKFDVDENPNNFDMLTLRMKYEDGFVAYLNGNEVDRSNFTGTPLWNSTADGDRQNELAEQFVDFDISDHISDLQQGGNVLAIHGLNVSASDPNFLIMPELIAGTSPNNYAYADDEAVLEGLRITEIMYHPAAGEPNSEFIELTNISDEPIDLTGVRFTRGVKFTFPAMTLDPDEYVVVVVDADEFTDRYGTEPNVVGEYTGRLDNGGEEIVLKLALPLRAAILRFDYNDNWYPSTDGSGFSLVIRDPYAKPKTWDDAESWRPSFVIGGSPGYAD